MATRRGIEFNPWNGMIAAVVIALATFATVFFLMRSTNRETLAEGGPIDEALLTVRDPDSPSTFNTTFSALVEPLREAEEQEYV
jgi:hypothetical protein